jgi:ATP-dependent exoDNAse (exonuclease V) beta subunit
MHLECEKNNGIEDIEKLITNDKYKYYCPWCRQRSKKSKRARKFIEKREKKCPSQVSDQTKKQNDCEPRKRELLIDHNFQHACSSLNELLQKYGGQLQQIGFEDIQQDLKLMRSLQSK